MQFLPLAVIVLGAGLAALVAIAVMVKMQKPGVKGISPHHRRNHETDVVNARDAEAETSRSQA